MSVIIVLIIVSLLVATLFLIFFIWAIHNGQYDDTHTPSVRMLWDDEKKDGAKALDTRLKINIEESKRL